MGYAIAIEGIDGAGKHTVCENLKKMIEVFTDDVELISFPQHNEISASLVDAFLYKDLKFTGSDFDKAVVESLLYSIDRLVTLNKYNKDLKMSYNEKYNSSNSIFIFDRYMYSNFIHRCNKLNQNEFQAFENKMKRIEYGEMKIIKPDALFFLNIEPEIAYKNIEKRGRQKDHNENLANLKIASNNVKEVQKMNLSSYLINVNSEKNDSGMLTPEEISMTIFKILLRDDQFINIFDFNRVFNMLNILNKKEME